MMKRQKFSTSAEEFIPCAPPQFSNLTGVLIYYLMRFLEVCDISRVFITNTVLAGRVKEMCGDYHEFAELYLTPRLFARLRVLLPDTTSYWSLLVSHWTARQNRDHIRNNTLQPIQTPTSNKSFDDFIFTLDVQKYDTKLKFLVTVQFKDDPLGEMELIFAADDLNELRTTRKASLLHTIEHYDAAFRDEEYLVMPWSFDLYVSNQDQTHTGRFLQTDGLYGDDTCDFENGILRYQCGDCRYHPISNSFGVLLNVALEEQPQADGSVDIDVTGITVYVCEYDGKSDDSDDNVHHESYKSQMIGIMNGLASGRLSRYYDEDWHEGAHYSFGT